MLGSAFSVQTFPPAIFQVPGSNHWCFRVSQNKNCQYF